MRPTFLVLISGFADSALALVGPKSRWGWKQEGSFLVGMWWSWLGSPAQHSLLDHQRVAARSCRTSTCLEAGWHIKSGRQGVSQRGRPPWLHNNDLRRSWDGKFLMQTSMNLSTSGFGAFRLWEWCLLRMVNSAAATGAFPPFCDRWRGLLMFHQAEAAVSHLKMMDPHLRMSGEDYWWNVTYFNL